VRRGSLLILGNGGAAISAAFSARASGYEGAIHLVSDFEGPAFNPVLAPYFLKGLIPWERCFPFGPGFYDSHDIKCHLGAAVESLDAVGREVVLADGRRLAYDKCLVATGASPVIPPVPGLAGSRRAFILRTADSAKRLNEVIRSAGRILVLGASFVGLKVAEVLVKRGIRVTLLDVASQVLPRSANPESAAMIQKLFETHGLDVRLGCAMDGMEGVDEGVVCHFSNHVIEEADLVMVCTGVRPNIDFVDRALVRIDQAILVDEHMETNVPGLYASGDASQGINLLTGRHEWLGTWENARLQGRIAGANMAGKDSRYPGSTPQNIGPFFDWTYAQLGNVHPDGGSVTPRIFGNPTKGGHLALYFQEDVLVGANLINCSRLAGILRKAIIQRKPWAKSLERSPTVEGIERALWRASDDLRGPALKRLFVLPA